MIARWHTPCQKDSERHGWIEKGSVGKNEEGFDSNILFVGFDVLVASRSGANTIIGGGGAAVYTYGIRDKDNRRYYRRY